MDKLTRAIALLSLLSFFAAASGQPGAGGSGMGGGFGGSGVVGPNDTVSARHILTPGERGEWDIEVKGGESFIITAESTVFDPVIEIVGARESVLAENDDVAPGDQRAQVLYRFPHRGQVQSAGQVVPIEGRRAIPVHTKAVRLGERAPRHDSRSAHRAWAKPMVPFFCDQGSTRARSHRRHAGQRTRVLCPQWRRVRR